MFVTDIIFELVRIDSVKHMFKIINISEEFPTTQSSQKMSFPY